MFWLIFFLPSSYLIASSEFTVSDAIFRVNNTWMLVATFLVFIMHLGFATLESGLSRRQTELRGTPNSGVT